MDNRIVHLERKIDIIRTLERYMKIDGEYLPPKSGKEVLSMCYKLLWQMKYRLLDRVKLDEQERAVLPTAEVYIKTIQGLADDAQERLHYGGKSFPMPNLVGSSPQQARLYMRSIDMGAFGLIYLALIERGGVVGTKMACKKAQPGVDSITTERRRLREQGIWAGLTHRHILPFLGQTEIQGEKFSLAPFAQHGTLDEFVAMANPPMVVRVTMLCDLASSLKYLHSQSPAILHGDLKPQNVFVSGIPSSPHVWLADFGLSKEDLRNTSEGSKYSGTVPYMSPERLSDDEDTPHTRTQKDDVFAFGITMSAVINGNEPYPQLVGLDDDRQKWSAILMVIGDDKRPARGSGKLWDIAAHCWNGMAVRRPTMAEVHGWLVSFMIVGDSMELRALEHAPYVMPNLPQR